MRQSLNYLHGVHGRWPQFILLSALAVLAACSESLPFNERFTRATAETPEGMIPTDCWFSSLPAWPDTECYYMQVPENYDKPLGRQVRFPVVIFKSPTPVEGASPVLHTGGGGPGGPLYLDDTKSVGFLITDQRKMSLDIGRDFYAIDPRGTGLSEPLLSCQLFVDNLPYRLQHNLDWKQAEEMIDADYLGCIKQFHAEGVDFNQYNSPIIARDIDSLRRATNNEQLVLLGVSYGTVYAQLMADQFPGRVESMILDSPVFLEIKGHHFFVEEIMSSWTLLENYCEAVKDCDLPIPDVRMRVLSIYISLEKQPIALSVKHPNDDSELPIVLDGDLFISALYTGLYGEQILTDLPVILVELEGRETTALQSHLADHLAYMFDPSWGDLAGSAHSCFEHLPFTDTLVMRDKLDQLPEGYIRDAAAFWIDTDDYCDAMKVRPGPSMMTETSGSDVPVLFLQGNLDTITPAKITETQLEKFENRKILYYDQSHDVIGSNFCAERDAARFIDTHSMDDEYNCDYESATVMPTVSPATEPDRGLENALR